MQLLKGKWQKVTFHLPLPTVLGILLSTFLDIKALFFPWQLRSPEPPAFLAGKCFLPKIPSKLPHPVARLSPSSLFSALIGSVLAST